MPFPILTLDQTRALGRDQITAKLHSSPLLPVSVARVLADSNGGLAFLTFMYISWLAEQLLPDTAESEWLDRFANIWLVAPRKPPFFAVGSVVIASGQQGKIIPIGQKFLSGAGPAYQSTAQVTIGSGPTTIPIVALTAGEVGNLDPGTVLALSPFIQNVDATCTVVSLTGGAEKETDDQLKPRVLLRIQQPPMGGSATDYVQWLLNVPGITRAWCSPLGAGVGTTVAYFMMDSLRAANNGFPTPSDVAITQAYIDSVRPVTAQDIYVSAPTLWPINFTLNNLSTLNSSTLTNISNAVSAVLAAQAAPASNNNGTPIPATTIWASWVSDAVSSADGVDHFDLVMDDALPLSPSSLAVLGTIIAPPTGPPTDLTLPSII